MPKVEQGRFLAVGPMVEIGAHFSLLRHCGRPQLRRCGRGFCHRPHLIAADGGGDGDVGESFRVVLGRVVGVRAVVLI